MESVTCGICGKEHPRGIGATLLPRIFGLVPKTNALDVYHLLTRPQPEPEDVDAEDESIDTLRGHRLEADAAADYWRLTGRNGAKVPGATSHPDYPAFQVHLDYRIFADQGREDGKRGTGNLELKAPRSSRFRRILDHGLVQRELVQTWTQSAVARYDWGSLAFYNLEDNRGPLYWIDQILDPAMGDFLLRAGQRFWDEHVVARVAPDPTEWELFAKDGAPKLVELGGDIVQVVEEEAVRLAAELLEARELRDRGEALYKERGAALLAWQKENAKSKKIQLPDGAKFSIVQGEGRVSFSKELLAHARPIDWDLARDYLRNVGVPEGELDEVLEGMTLDLSRFETRGDPYEYLLPPRAKGDRG